MQFRHFLEKIAQRCECVGRCLNFVQKQDVLSGDNGLAGKQGQRGKDAAGIPYRERLVKLRITLQVRRYQWHAYGPSELAHQR